MFVAVVWCGPCPQLPVWGRDSSRCWLLSPVPDPRSRRRKGGDPTNLQRALPLSFPPPCFLLVPTPPPCGLRQGSVLEKVTHLWASVLSQVHLPFAVVGSTEEVKIGNKMAKARQYPWGVVQGRCTLRGGESSCFTPAATVLIFPSLPCLWGCSAAGGRGRQGCTGGSCQARKQDMVARWVASGEKGPRATEAAPQECGLVWLSHCALLAGESRPSNFTPFLRLSAAKLRKLLNISCKREGTCFSVISGKLVSQ